MDNGSIEAVTLCNQVASKQGKVRIVCTSDTHSGVEDDPQSFTVPDGDVLIHAGDFTNFGEVDKVKKFNSWLGTLPHTVKLVVAGNRDITFDPSVVGPNNKHWEKLQHPDMKEVKSYLTNCIYLEDASVIINGFKFHGTPWTPIKAHKSISHAAFQIPRSDVSRWEQVCSNIPSDTDILISHCPPYGILVINKKNHSTFLKRMSTCTLSGCQC